MKMIEPKILGTNSIKSMAERLKNNILYKVIIFLAMGYDLIMCTWSVFFHDDFLARTTLWIILLVTLALILLSKVLNAIVKEGKKSEVVL